MGYFGRKKIYTTEKYIDEKNLQSVLFKALETHLFNVNDMEYLYKYYCGDTPILRKTKEVRKSINNKVSVNRAYEIVSFFLGYSYGEPIKYTNRSNLENSAQIQRLNDIMVSLNKPYLDTRLAFWQLVCGTAYRYVFPKRTGIGVYSKDPFKTFVIYKNDITEEPIAGVTYSGDNDGERYFTVYTEDSCYFYDERLSKITKDNGYTALNGDLPIIEYPRNESRLGVFEPALDLMDAIAMLESNVLDNVQQNVNGFLAIKGSTIDEKTLNLLEENKVLCLPDGVGVEYLETKLDIAAVQSLCDDLYQQILSIVGIPSRNGSNGASTSDSGQAVVLRNGWSNSETYAKIDTRYFVASEREFLRKALSYLRLSDNLTISVDDIDITSNRHNTENLVAKTQALMNMINAGIAPEDAISACGIWSDPLSIFEHSKPYMESANEQSGTDTGIIQTT